MAENPTQSAQRKLIEPVAAVLMALTTLCTAWCSYEIRRVDPAKQPADERIQCVGSTGRAARCARQRGADHSRLNVHAAPRYAARRQRKARQLLFAVVRMLLMPAV